MRELFDKHHDYVRRYLRDRWWGRQLPIDEVAMTERYSLNIVREAMELLDEVPWKDHRLYDDRSVIRDNVLEEVADIVLYALSVAHVWEASYPEVEAALTTKLAVIEYRWKEEHTPLDPDAPIALVDIDGVLAEWPGPFLKFASARVGEEFKDLEDLQENFPVEAKQAKHLYRQSGLKRTLPAIQSNVIGVRALEHAGFQIVLLSTRPAHRYSRIYGDTLFWLNANRIPFDRLVFTEDKSLKVALSDYIGRIKFAVDDDMDNVDKLRDLGIKVYHIGRDFESMLEIPEVAEEVYREGD